MEHKCNLGFGMMRLPQLDDDISHVDLEKTCQLVDAFLDKGYTYFDTSYVYHGGKSQEITRKALVERHPRDSFTLATKLPTWMAQNPQAVEEIFQSQLKDCGVEYFDYYLVHNMNSFFYDKLITPNHVFETLNQCKQEGKIRNLGFSFHDCPELLDRILTDHPELDFVQIAVKLL